MTWTCVRCGASTPGGPEQVPDGWRASLNPDHGKTGGFCPPCKELISELRKLTKPVSFRRW